MKVLKFGGTSVGSAASIRNVKKIVAGVEGENLLVLSAMSGVTNLLVQINEYFKNNDVSNATIIVEELRTKHLELVQELIPSENSEVQKHVNKLFDQFAEILLQESSENAEAKILTFGETVSTYIVSEYFQAEGVTEYPARG
jgi:aspartate kinase